MTTEGSIAGLELFDGLNSAYEDAYKNNPFKVSIVSHAISLLKEKETFQTDSSLSVLDVGCGTGVPVSQLLAENKFDVHGFDISPRMVQLAKSRIQGTFTENDMVGFQPPRSYAAIFIIFSQLQLKYADFHASCWKLVQALEPNGLLVIGQSPADTYVKDEAEYDGSGAYVEDCNIPFMGKPLPTFAMTAEGQRKFLTSMGLEVVRETIDTFQPDHPDCDPEEQQYIIARRPGDFVLTTPHPLPK